MEEGRPSDDTNIEATSSNMAINIPDFSAIAAESVQSSIAALLASSESQSVQSVAEPSSIAGPSHAPSSTAMISLLEHAKPTKADDEGGKELSEIFLKAFLAALALQNRKDYEEAIEQYQHVQQLLESTNSAVAQQILVCRQQLAAQREVAKEDAQRQAAEDRIRQLEEENRKLKAALLLKNDQLSPLPNGANHSTPPVQNPWSPDDLVNELKLSPRKVALPEKLEHPDPKSLIGVGDQTQQMTICGGTAGPNLTTTEGSVISLVNMMVVLAGGGGSGGVGRGGGGKRALKNTNAFANAPPPKRMNSVSVLKIDNHSPQQTHSEPSPTAKFTSKENGGNGTAPVTLSTTAGAGGGSGGGRWRHDDIPKEKIIDIYEAEKVLESNNNKH